MDLQPTFLCFRTSATELDYQRQPDANFRQYVACAALVFLILAAIQLVLVPTSQLTVLALLTTATILSFFLALAWSSQKDTPALGGGVGAAATACNDKGE